MAKGRPSQQHGTLAPDLAAIALVTLAFLLLASLIYAHKDSGPLLNFLADALQLSLGMGAWLVPLVCLAAGVCLGMEERPALPRRVLIGATIVYLVLLAMLHLASLSTDAATPAGMRLAGGYLGAGVAWLLSSAFGDLGAYIVLVGTALAGTIMVAQSSWMEFLSGLGETLIRAGELVGHGLAALVPRPPARPRARRRRPRAEAEDTSEEEVLPEREARAPRRRPSQGIFDPAEEGEGAATGQARPDERLPIQDPGPAAGPPASAQGKRPAGRAPGAQGASADHLATLDDEPATRHHWDLPPVDVLPSHPDDRTTAEDTATINTQIETIEETLLNFGIPARVVAYQHGPTLTRYEVELDPGIRVSKVIQLQRELAMALAVGGSLRIEAPIPGKRAVGIEVPNRDRRIVSLRSVIASDEFQDHRSLLAVALGKDVAGEPIIVDLEPMPHLLVAGQTGSGKSVCLHTIIVSLLMRATPEQVRLVIIDPKRVEMTIYDSIPHLFCPVVYTLREAADVLRKCIREMQRRYDRFAVAGVSNIREYNLQAIEEAEETGVAPEPLPRIVVIIDELADLMTRARAEFEQSICQLARLARATGIYVIAATQRPSVNVITGHIKANFAARIAMRLPASHDSRTILDSVGADKLLGCGDMLLLTSELSKPLRVQGAYVDRPDLAELAQFIQAQGEPEFAIVPDFVVDDGETDDMGEEVEVGDELFESAVRYVVAEQEASVSMLQRRFKIGYARAGRLIDLMERRGIVGPHEGSRPRRVLAGLHNVDEILAGVRPGSGEPEIEPESGPEQDPEEEPQASGLRT